MGRRFFIEKGEATTNLALDKHVQNQPTSEFQFRPVAEMAEAMRILDGIAIDYRRYVETELTAASKA